MPQLKHNYVLCGGDARRLLNIAEILAGSVVPDGQGQRHVTEDAFIQAAGQFIVYDKQGDWHFDIGHRIS